MKSCSSAARLFLKPLYKQAERTEVNGALHGTTSSSLVSFPRATGGSARCSCIISTVSIQTGTGLFVLQLDVRNQVVRSLPDRKIVMFFHELLNKLSAFSRCSSTRVISSHANGCGPVTIINGCAR